MSEAQQAIGIEERKEKCKIHEKAMLDEAFDHPLTEPVPDHLFDSFCLGARSLFDLCKEAGKGFYTFTRLAASTQKKRGRTHKFNCFSEAWKLNAYLSHFNHRLKSENKQFFCGVGINFDQSFDTLGELKDKLEKTLNENKVSPVAVGNKRKR